MKKVLVLGLVLGLACAANAALTIEGLPASGKINLSAVVKLSLTGDGQTPSPQAPWIVVKGPASINGGTLVYQGSLSAYWDLPRLVTELGMSEADILAYVGGSDTSMITLADGAIPPKALTGVLVDNIMLTASATKLGMVDLILMNDDLTAAISQARVEVVPEPMTIALLGLGGLFLRRRK